MNSIWKESKRIGRNVFWGLFMILILSNSGVPSLKFTEVVRVNTRWIEFDYVSWTLEALWRKAAQISLGTVRYANEDQQSKIVDQYFNLVNEDNQLKSKINTIYSDPEILNPLNQAEPYLQRQDEVQEELKHVGYLYESILQQQVSSVASENHLGFLNQPVPPIQYHTTPLPYALIVSPRDVIRQDVDISLLPELSLDQIVELEQTVESRLNVSALVVQIGGVGVYPTMVMETSNLNWLSDTVAHEWTHNYLTLHPLGMLYEQTPELRTINETTASIAGNEMGSEVIENFYPALVPEPVVEKDSSNETDSSTPQEPPPFDFRAAMHETRVTVDQMLSENKIEEAEAYMNERRLLFIQNGYNIRRLNQAYFAFHGAYADQPGGAAGEDPVGAAVRNLRAQSENLSSFLKKIAWVTSFDQLLRMEK